MNAGTKIAVCIPTCGSWEPDFGMSLAGLLREVYCRPSEKLVGAGIEIVNTRGSILPQVRHNLLRVAMRMQATHAFFLDDDMVMPTNALHQLMEVGEDFVAAAGVTKEVNSVVAAQGLDKMPLSLEGENLVKVNHVGLACALIRLQPLYERKLLPPFFDQTWQANLGAYAGEDVFFCQKWRKAGGDIYVHRSLSRGLGHVGKKTWKWTPPEETLTLPLAVTHGR